MSKFLSFLLCFSVLASACQSEPAETGMPLEESLESTVGEEPTEVLPVEVHFEPGRESTVASSDYTLVDNTGYGFAYDASNVLDQDFSTAWCQSEIDPEVDGPFAGGMTLTFTESPAGKMVGIVPGFARDETIYFQNNRIKQLVLQDGPSPILEDNIVFDFEDSYGMQFFQLPEGVDESLTFYVSDVYPGSKYDDTCIAEMDLWSDYVENEDAEAAIDYYLENKEAYALRPVGIKNLAMSFGAEGNNGVPGHLVAKTLNSCGQINQTLYEFELSGNDTQYSWADTGEWAYIHNNFAGEGGGYWGLSEWMSSAGNVPAVSVEMNEWAKEGDLITIKWIDLYLIDMETGEMGSRLIDSEEVSVKLCTDGSLHASSILSANEGEHSFWGGGEVEVYFNDRLLGQTDYSLPQ